jgi:hypothetical protein
LLVQSQKPVQESLWPQGRESAASLACGFFAAAKDRAAVNQEAGDFPSVETFFAAAEKCNSIPLGG